MLRQGDKRKCSCLCCPRRPAAAGPQEPPRAWQLQERTGPPAQGEAPSPGRGPPPARSPPRPPGGLDAWLSLTDFTSRRSPLGTTGGSGDGSGVCSGSAASRGRWRPCRWLWLRRTRWAVSMTTAEFRLSAAMARSSSSSSPASQASLVLLSNSWKVLTRLAFTGVVGTLGAALSKLQRRGQASARAPRRLERRPETSERSPTDARASQEQGTRQTPAEMSTPPSTVLQPRFVKGRKKSRHDPEAPRAGLGKALRTAACVSGGQGLTTVAPPRPQANGPGHSATEPPPPPGRGACTPAHLRTPPRAAVGVGAGDTVHRTRACGRGIWTRWFQGCPLTPAPPRVWNSPHPSGPPRPPLPTHASGGEAQVQARRKARSKGSKCPLGAGPGAPHMQQQLDLSLWTQKPLSSPQEFQGAGVGVGAHHSPRTRAGQQPCEN